ncbi:MAG: hypothetical protein P1V19_02345, partial [Gimesia sp.]|nr:hypothetical protein [Gimesia sp.]
MSVKKRRVVDQYTKGIVAVLLVTGVATAVMITNCEDATAASTVYVGKKVSLNSLLSMDQINHSSWDALLKKYVDS